VGSSSRPFLYPRKANAKEYVSQAPQAHAPAPAPEEQQVRDAALTTPPRPSVCLLVVWRLLIPRDTAPHSIPKKQKGDDRNSNSNHSLLPRPPPHLPSLPPPSHTNNSKTPPQR
jgi:hypothetical protein